MMPDVASDIHGNMGIRIESVRKTGTIDFIFHPEDFRIYTGKVCIQAQGEPYKIPAFFIISREGLSAET